MTLELFLFNIFYFFIITSALFVIFSENAVYSVLFLILTFCNIIFLLLLMGAEFFAFLLLIVYVGAIAVLFLFVVMMLNIKKLNYSEFNTYFIYYTPIIFISILFFFDYFLNFVPLFDVLKILPTELIWINWLEEINFVTNTKSIGNILYTNYCLLFIVASFVLLVSMVGVIVLTIHQKTILLLKKQNINFQLTRNAKTTLKFMKIRKYKF
nr:NADH dehydrogenase subunit 6 [Neorhodomela munita]